MKKNFGFESAFFCLIFRRSCDKYPIIASIRKGKLLCGCLCITRNLIQVLIVKRVKVNPTNKIRPSKLRIIQ